MAKYRINSRGANHTRKENGEYRRYGKGDVIELDEASVNAGLFDHLKPVKVSGDVATTSTPASTLPELGAGGLTQEQQDQIAQAKADADAKNQIAQELIALAEAASTAKEIKEIGEKAITAGLFTEAPDKKSDLIEVLAAFSEAAAGE